MEINASAIEKHLAKEMEGGLFAEIFISSIFGKTYGLQRVWYTVENGVVYTLYGSKKSPTGDSLISVHSSCRRVGDYEPGKFYPVEIRDFSYAQINHLLRNAEHHPQT